VPRLNLGDEKYQLTEQESSSWDLVYPAMSAFYIELAAEAGLAELVPIAGGDIVWTIEGDPGLIIFDEGQNSPTSRGTVFVTSPTGKEGQAEIVGHAAILDLTTRIRVTVVPAEDK
jgi:hypothetical protein